ncbi:MAG TPA: radical SAM protein [Chitinophagales bacterium]|nr:radical SAM protein [Chitinophagales bacterium]
MKLPILLITPPFTQLNTPYPATPYLKGFLNTQGIKSRQMDLGIDVILKIFCKAGIENIFETVVNNPSLQLSENSERIAALSIFYIQTIDAVIQYLQNGQPTLAHQICSRSYLPEASRFELLEEMEWAFGSMGIQDKARHLCTLYLEDLSDFIIENIDENFGFSRYAERLGRSAHTFDELYESLNQDNTYIDEVTLDLLKKSIEEFSPRMVGFSVPFPGNLYSAFKCAQWIKKNYPEIKVIMGGGFPNTELRSVTDARVFEFFDWITLDDGEAPILLLTQWLDGKINDDELKRTLSLNKEEQVTYFDKSIFKDFSTSQVGIPDYSDLPLDKYLSVIEIANPMHRLWSDGRWNKLTLAHGCYWGKCTFCDINLDYIGRYEPTTAKHLCDKIETMISNTGETGFHFVDEAAPPSLLKELALEILRRELTITWWANIRFEKNFTADLCLLLKTAGCIAVSGGIEVASDRLLQLIDKGITIEQVSKVTHHFTQSGIMVHSYLMYGFPTQTVQETIDSLEVVRQLFEEGIVHSGFWHQFALTAHSPVGKNPEKFGVKITTAGIGSFANNDLEFKDLTGTQHDKFSEGLRKSLFNYMHGICFENTLQSWFDFKIPKTTHPPYMIKSFVQKKSFKETPPHHKVFWLGGNVKVLTQKTVRKGKKIEETFLRIFHVNETIDIKCTSSIANWFQQYLPTLNPKVATNNTYKKINESYLSSTSEEIGVFIHSAQGQLLKENGWIIV